MNYTNTTINERELFIMNHKGWLYGTLYDDYASADHLMYRFTFRNPKGLILGDLSKTDFLYNYKQDKNNYYLGFNIFPVNNENLIARQELMDYFKTDFPRSLLYFKHDKDYICSFADFKNNSKIFDPNLTSSYYACFNDNIKLFYGGNSKILLEEDLAINLNLEDLQKIFFESLEKYRDIASINSFNPCLNLIDFNIHYKNVVQKNFTEILYDKKCQYSAAVFRKIHEIYDENILLIPNSLVDLTYSYAVDSLCPELTKIFRNKQFIKKVSEIKPTAENFEETIEKLVLINLLTYDEFKNFIFSGVNPLKDLFFGLYKDFPLSKILETYKKYYFIYCEELMNIFCEDLTRINLTETDGRKYYKIYDDEINEIQKENRNEFLIDKYTLENYMTFGMNLLMIQINLNIKKRELNGENLISTKLSLKKLFVNGIKNKQNLNNYNELLAQANSQLKIFKLPKSFKKYEKKIKETILDDYKNLIGENFEEACFEAMKKIQQDIYELNSQEKIVKTGAEPELKSYEIKNINSKNNLDFFTQGKIIEDFIEKEKKNNNLHILKEKNEQNSKIFEDVSLKDIDKEITKLRIKLGIELRQDYLVDGKNPDMEKINQKVKEIKSEKFKSITNFKDFNTENLEDDTASENDRSNAYFFLDKNEKNLNFSNVNSEKDEKMLKKLETIRYLKQGLQEELNNELENSENPELNPLNFIDLDIFKGKSLEQIKELEIEELHESNVEVSNNSINNINSVQIGDSYYKYATESMVKNTSTIDLTNQQAEINFQMAYDKIRRELVHTDKARAAKVINSLESGEYLDDPYYIGVLMQSKKYLKLRESFLKKYFKEGPKNNISMPLLGKYINKPGDIVDNMLVDGVFDRYDSQIGNVYVGLLKDYVNALDAEEVFEEKNLSLLDMENNKSSLQKLDEEELEDASFNVHELNKKLSSQYDEFYVSKQDIEKELGWRKVSNKENGESGHKEMFENGNSDFAIENGGGKNSYIPGSNRAKNNRYKKKI